MDEVSKSRKIKEEKVSNVTEKIGRAKSVVFADYRGLGANQIGELRNQIKKVGGEMLICKNTLLSLALKSNKLPSSEEQLEGPTALVLSYDDEVATVKEIAENAKKSGLPKFKFGFLGSELMDSSSLETLAKIPGRDVLYGKVVGSLASPIYGVVNVLSANIRNLVSVLDQKAKQGV